MAWNDHEKDMEVRFNGQCISPPMTRKEAEALAEFLGRGLPDHAEGTRIRQPHVEIGPHRVRKEMDALYRAMKTHTMVQR